MATMRIYQKRPSGERFLKKVEISHNCWYWRGAVDPTGYGKFKDGSSNFYAHRFSYQYYKGKIPKGLVIDHLCRNKNCVNPNHLEPVTQRENILRGIGIAKINSQKTRCINNHLLSGQNLYICPRGKRECRTCRKAAKLRWELSHV